jgi:hypothetical protein
MPELPDNNRAAPQQAAEQHAEAMLAHRKAASETERMLSTTQSLP